MKLGPYELGPNDTPEQAIYEGDSMELTSLIPDESVDLFMADPRYHYSGDYEWAASVATRILKPGGSLILQTGHIYWFENAMAIGKSGLTPCPILSEVFSGGFKSIWKYKCSRNSVNYFWFSKGETNQDRGWPRTAFWGSKEKKYHRWGDGVRGFLFLLERLTKEGDIVFDPFTGGGTIPAACIITGRHYLAFEIDHDTCLMARQRVRETQPPLLQVPPQQLVLMKGNNNHETE